MSFGCVSSKAVVYKSVIDKMFSINAVYKQFYNLNVTFDCEGV